MVITDGRYAVCTLDRNGLRPSRWVITNDDTITVASEVGVYKYRPEDVVAKGRLGPGEILSVDTETGQLLHTSDIDDLLKAGNPYRQWLDAAALRIDELSDKEVGESGVAKNQLKTYMKMYQASLEERVQVITPLANTAQEAIGSMGDDTPLAVLSDKYRPLYHFFRQNFSQVTNPPIDSLRENKVMSLKTRFGNLGNILDFQ